jgi:hypothetical protein
VEIGRRPVEREKQRMPHRLHLTLLLLLGALTLPSQASASIIIVASTPQASGGQFVTSLSPYPFSGLGLGLPDAITTLFGSDYPGFTYANAATPADGTLTISTLSAFQNGIQGGLNIVVSYEPDSGVHAPHIFDWLQYVTITPLTTPFRGADSSPFTDPPPLDRDDNLPFYWTTSQRDTQGLGYVTGGNINDDPKFSDAPRANDVRAPVEMSFYLYLADFDASSQKITVYEGLEYGFNIEPVPEPGTIGMVLGVLALFFFSRVKKCPEPAE